MVFPRLVLAGIGLVVPLAAYAQSATDFATLARSAGQPQIPGLRIVYLDEARRSGAGAVAEHHPAPDRRRARRGRGHWPRRQSKNPTRRGVTLWVETDGTVYWATPETIVTTHGDGANRNDNKYIDNSKTYRQVTRINSIGVEFNGNAPDVRAPPTPEQFAASLLLVRFLQERYGIPAERIYAHNWIDYKDARYCEGCELAHCAPARRPIGRGRVNLPKASDVMPPAARGGDCPARHARGA